MFNSSKTWKVTNFCLQQKLIITLHISIINFKVAWWAKIVKIQQSEQKSIISLHISIIYFRVAWWAKIVKIQRSDNGILKWINGRKKNEKFNATKNKTNF